MCGHVAALLSVTTLEDRTTLATYTLADDCDRDGGADPVSYAFTGTP